MTYNRVNILFEYLSNLVFLAIDLIVNWFDTVRCLTGAILNEFLDIADKLSDFVTH
jgi:hypothetical protein